MMNNGGLKIGPNYFHPLSLYYMLVVAIRPQSLPSAVSGALDDIYQVNKTIE